MAHSARLIESGHSLTDIVMMYTSLGLDIIAVVSVISIFIFMIHVLWEDRHLYW